LNVSLLVCITFGFTAISGLIFAICWTLLKDDISGAYTVASYITALMTLLLMAVMSVVAGV
jgi:NADH:ubiquinone oxidoreductase subunit 6 (subunit J)